VVIDTLGHSFWICAVHRLNSGYSRLDPVSCRETELVGQFSRLFSEAAAEVVVVVALVVAVVDGDELHAARRTAAAATTDNTATPPNRLFRPWGVPWAGTAERRVGMADEAPFDWNDRGSVGGDW
jgi:hypothetical protein